MDQCVVVVREDRMVMTAGKIGLALVAMAASILLVPPLLLAVVVAGKVAIASLSVVTALCSALGGLVTGGIALVFSLAIAAVSVLGALLVAVASLLVQLGLYLALPIALVSFFVMVLQAED